MYAEKYSTLQQFVPHSYMGLIASWQVKEYLKPSDRWRVMLQAFWYLGSELRSWEVPARRQVTEIEVSAKGLDSAFSEAVANGDVTSFYSAFAARYRDTRTSRAASRALLSAAIRDNTNVGHKYIYIAKTLQLGQDTGWENPLLFYAPIHFLVVAPRDTSLSLTAQAQLEPLVHNLGSLANGQKTIDYDTVIHLRDAIFRGREDTLTVLADLLQQGYSPQDVMEALLLVASHFVYYAPHQDSRFWWVYPVHGFNFTQSVSYGLKFMEAPASLLAVLVNGLYLGEIARLTGKMDLDGSIRLSDGTAEASLERLEESVESSNATEAIAQVRGLMARRVDFGTLAEKLVLLSARNEKFPFTHVVKYLYLLLSSLSASSPWSEEHVVAFVRFLSLASKERQVARVADAVAKRGVG